VNWPLGIAMTVYRDLPLEEAARLAREDGFEHIDARHDSPTNLAVPLGDCYSPRPAPGFTSGPAAEGTRSWEKTVADFKRAPGSRLEPWPGAVVGSTEAVLAFLEEVPGQRLTIDVGHVTAWGGDPLELLPYADHVQLRQARPGATQAPDDGVVDYAAILKRLEALDYRGILTIEYFDLPDRGWPLDDPLGAAREALAELRALGVGRS